MRYCPHCQRNVRGIKRLSVFAWIVIVLLSGATLGIFLVCFIFYFLLIKPYSCPICYTIDLQKVMQQPSFANGAQPLYPVAKTTVELPAAPGLTWSCRCGATNVGEYSICQNCNRDVNPTP